MMLARSNNEVSGGVLQPYNRKCQPRSDLPGCSRAPCASAAPCAVEAHESPEPGSERSDSDSSGYSHVSTLISASDSGLRNAYNSTKPTVRVRLKLDQASNKRTAPSPAHSSSNAQFTLWTQAHADGNDHNRRLIGQSRARPAGQTTVPHTRQPRTACLQTRRAPRPRHTCETNATHEMKHAE